MIEVVTVSPLEMLLWIESADEIAGGETANAVGATISRPITEPKMKAARQSNFEARRVFMARRVEAERRCDVVVGPACHSRA